MCTLVVLFRPQHAWPVLIAANRDEMLNRRWRPPARHWSERQRVVAGLDEIGHGSWFGVNDDGVTAGVLNRADSLGPAAGKRSRGELVLQALEHADARSAAAALSQVNSAAYRGFNLVIADSVSVFWLRHRENASPERIELLPLLEGVSMLTAHDTNDLSSARIRRYLPLWRQAAAPDPERGDFSAWEQLLASRESDADRAREGAMNVVTDFGFGTVSSLLLALPARGRDTKPRFRFAAGRPDETKFEEVPL